MCLKVDEEFKKLIPPLTNEEFAQLEENILRYGIQDPLKVWKGTLIDGHNRFEIAQKHNLTFETTEMTFDSRDEVKSWIVLNQIGRRNLTPYNRVCIALKLKPVIASDAEKRMKAGKAAPAQIFGQGSTNAQIAKIAGVSEETVRKVEKIESEALPEIKSALIAGKMSISSAYQSLQVDKDAIIKQIELDQRVKDIKEHLEKSKYYARMTLEKENKIRAAVSDEKYREYVEKVYSVDVETWHNFLKVMSGDETAEKYFTDDSFADTFVKIFRIDSALTQDK